MMNWCLLAFAFCLCLSWQQSSCLPAPEASEEFISNFIGNLTEEDLMKRLLDMDFDTNANGQTSLQIDDREYDPIIMAQGTKLSQKGINEILALHKQTRDEVWDSLEPFPDMTWDNDLARLAQGLADTCTFKHLNMKLPNGQRTGQNLGVFRTTDDSFSGVLAAQLTKSWINERDFYKRVPGTPFFACKKQPCGHYTQMVWSTTTKIGCGAANCHNGLDPRSEKVNWGTDKAYLLVCDYLTPQTGLNPYEVDMNAKRPTAPCVDEGDFCQQIVAFCDDPTFAFAESCKKTCGKCGKPKCKGNDEERCSRVPVSWCTINNARVKKNMLRKCPKKCQVCE